MTNLEKLEIWAFNKKDKNVSFEPFKNLKKLNSLEIWGDSDSGFFEKDLLSNFENVVELNLLDCKLDQNDINVIGSYKKLVKLHIYKVTY